MFIDLEELARPFAPLFVEMLEYQKQNLRFWNGIHQQVLAFWGL
ncbi:MAG: hypothetical protein AAB442_01840 [Patescibacteria group bacterium]